MRMASSNQDPWPEDREDSMVPPPEEWDGMGEDAGREVRIGLRGVDPPEGAPAVPVREFSFHRFFLVGRVHDLLLDRFGGTTA